MNNRKMLLLSPIVFSSFRNACARATRLGLLDFEVREERGGYRIYAAL